jgi:hypothetical protein
MKALGYRAGISVRVLAVGVLAAFATNCLQPALAVMGSVASNGGSVSTATLASPGSLSATGGLTVALQWTVTPSTFATGYDILRGTASGGPYVKVATVTPRTATSYTDTPTLPGTYYYVLQSVYQNWRSANSNQTSALFV